MYYFLLGSSNKSKALNTSSFFKLLIKMATWKQILGYGTLSAIGLAMGLYAASWGAKKIGIPVRELTGETQSILDGDIGSNHYSIRRTGFSRKGAETTITRKDASGNPTMTITAENRVSLIDLVRRRHNGVEVQSWRGELEPSWVNTGYVDVLTITTSDGKTTTYENSTLDAHDPNDEALWKATTEIADAARSLARGTNQSAETAAKTDAQRLRAAFP